MFLCNILLRYMHDFHICDSSSRRTFVPVWWRNVQDKREQEEVEFLKAAMRKNTSFSSGYPKLLRTHPPLDFSDSDCRLVASEDWIKVHHYFALRSVPIHGNKVAPTEEKVEKIKQLSYQKFTHSSYQHQEMSPYELALLLWRVLDIESLHAQDRVHNIHTNVHKPDDQGGKGSSQADQGEATAENGDSIDLDGASPERLADSYKERSELFSGILSDLETAAHDDVEIDAKKKLGLRQFTEYRSHRALSHMVFPVLAYVTSHPSTSVFV